MSSGAGDYSQEEFLGDGGHVINKHSFPCGVFNGWLVHDWVANWILWGLVGIHALFTNKASYFITMHPQALKPGNIYIAWYIHIYRYISISIYLYIYRYSLAYPKVKKNYKQLGIHICESTLIKIHTIKDKFWLQPPPHPKKGRLFLFALKDSTTLLKYQNTQ